MAMRMQSHIDRPIESPFRKTVITLFIIFYIMSVILWVLPWSRTRDFFIKPITQQIYYTGIWQGFAVFAPDPRKENYRIYATIRYDDGTEKIWHYPAMEKLGLFERYCKEHWRKYGNDCLNGNNLLWPDFARWVARANDEKSKHPLTVALTRTRTETMPPEDGFGKPNPEQLEKYQFYLYRVLPEDLKQTSQEISKQTSSENLKRKRHEDSK